MIIVKQDIVVYILLTGSNSQFQNFYFDWIFFPSKRIRLVKNLELVVGSIEQDINVCSGVKFLKCEFANLLPEEWLLGWTKSLSSALF